MWPERQEMQCILIIEFKIYVCVNVLNMYIPWRVVGHVVAGRCQVEYEKVQLFSKEVLIGSHMMCLWCQCLAE
jgi:hypothetical protein